jgi:hypothetical protein
MPHSRTLPVHESVSMSPDFAEGQYVMCHIHSPMSCREKEKNESSNIHVHFLPSNSIAYYMCEDA